MKPEGGGHQGSTLDVQTRITYTYVPGENAGDVTRVRIIYAGDEILNTTGPFSFAPPDPNNPNVVGCTFQEMGDGHGKASPGDYTVTAIVTITTMYGTIIGYDEWGEPIWEYQFVDTEVTDTADFGLDNKSPVAVNLRSPLSPASGLVDIDVDMIPAPAAGAGICDDFIDAVHYKLFDPAPPMEIMDWSLTHSEGYYNEMNEWVPTPHRWLSAWNTAELYTPENSPNSPQLWGDPRWPDKVYQFKVLALFGPNNKDWPADPIELRNRGSMSGTVKDRATQIPIAGAEVKAICYGRVVGTTTTDAGGAWTLPLYSTAYEIRASEGNYVTGSVWPYGLQVAEVRTGEVVELDRRITVGCTPGDPQPGTPAADGITPVTVWAIVRTCAGDPVPDGTNVTFTTDFGQLQPATAVTALDAEGNARAQVQLIPGESETDREAIVTAAADGATSNPTPVSFYGVRADLEVLGFFKSDGVTQIQGDIGGQAIVKVKVTATENVRCTRLLLKYQETDSPHADPWHELLSATDPATLTPVEQGADYKIYAFALDTLGLHNGGHSLVAEADFETTAFLKTVPRTLGFTVKNLVITDVTPAEYMPVGPGMPPTPITITLDDNDLEGGPVNIEVTIRATPDPLTVVRTIRVEGATGASHSISWDGKDDLDQAVGASYYTWDVHVTQPADNDSAAYRSGGLVVTAHGITFKMNDDPLLADETDQNDGPNDPAGPALDDPAASPPAPRDAIAIDGDSKGTAYVTYSLSAAPKPQSVDVVLFKVDLTQDDAETGLSDQMRDEGNPVVLHPTLPDFTEAQAAMRALITAADATALNQRDHQARRMLAWNQPALAVKRKTAFEFVLNSEQDSFLSEVRRYTYAPGSEDASWSVAGQWTGTSGAEGTFNDPNDEWDSPAGGPTPRNATHDPSEVPLMIGRRIPTAESGMVVTRYEMREGQLVPVGSIGYKYPILTRNGDQTHHEAPPGTRRRGVPVGDNLNRLLVHPDGGQGIGTQGCIGIHGYDGSVYCDERLSAVHTMKLPRARTMLPLFVVAPTFTGDPNVITYDSAYGIWYWTHIDGHYVP